jgi:hypothetical protein
MELKKKVRHDDAFAGAIGLRFHDQTAKRNRSFFAARKFPGIKH